MTAEEMINLYESGGIESKYEGDNLLQGMNILSKYIDTTKQRIIGGATHDEVWGPDLSKLENAGITIEDFTELMRLNWICNMDSDCLSLFV